jgi:uncharacterized protein (TIGR02594 family)
MYKILLAIVISLGVCSIPTIVDAKPAVHHVKKHKRIKKTKAAIVAPKNNPFLRCEGCKPALAAPVVASYETSNEESAGEFFRKDQERMLKQKLISKPLELNRDQKRQQVARSCSWFTCSNDNKVVMEAKAWEGKSAKQNNKELRKLFNDGNMPPIDPMRTPWCAAFANAILSRSGYETTNSLMARSFLTWGSKTKDPKEGDIVVLQRGRGNTFGHVGFFQGYEIIDGITYVKVFGGNTDHAVQVGYYPVSKVLGYRTVA